MATTSTVFDATIWIIDDDASIRRILQLTLEGEGYHVKALASADNALQALSLVNSDERPDLIFCDIRMPGKSGISLLSSLQKQSSTIPVIIMTAHSDLDATVNAYSAGAYDYITKPFDLDKITQLTAQALSETAIAEDTPTEKSLTKNTAMIGKSESMQAVYRIIGRLHNSAVSVLITGETGTGKELVAHALHQNSPRAKQPFIAINTAAIPRDLLESELFGHEKGAFTGANAQRKGRFEQANHGTLFLDEIGDMPIELQTRLLRVLAEGEFYRVGGQQPIRVDVRVVTATHQNLEALSSSGKFREDLYHRLNVIRLELPPLRERDGDISLLLHHFLNDIAAELGEAPKLLSAEAENLLGRYHWPGNVRQLSNVIRSALVMTSGQTIHVEDLPMGLLPDWDNNSQSPAPISTTKTAVSTPETSLSETQLTSASQPTLQSWQDALAVWARESLESGQPEIGITAIKSAEQVLIESVLAHTNGHRQAAAKHLGWGRNTLTRKIQQLDIDSDAS